MIKLLPQIALALWSIAPGNYSGITHVRNNFYAIVDDKDSVDGFKYLMLDIDSVSGELTNAYMSEPADMVMRRAEGVKTNRDCEGVAFCVHDSTIFVSGEADQRILEYSLSGEPTGRELDVPSIMKIDKIKGNYGFEALAYDSVFQRFWTTTESTLPADGKEASASNPDVINKLRLVAFDKSLKPTASYLYAMDKSLPVSSTSTVVFGVPSIVATGNGGLLIMEREACITKYKLGSWVKTKIYYVNPTVAVPYDMNMPMSLAKGNAFLEKRLICEFSTSLSLGHMNFANYEGMCLGPRLSDGSQTLILISDSQGGYGNSLFRLKDNIKIIVFDRL